tara:strand:+ start:3195 stop:4205 length:1011 start_codon:yes stop_codon:yes gene_type:complete
VPISNDLLSSTLFSIRDSEVDELYKKVAFLDGVRKAGGVETESGGIKIQRPLSIQEHSSITQLATGYEAVSLAVNDVLRPAIYDWADFTAPIVVTKKEELENSGEYAVVKIVEARMKSVMGMLRRELNKQVLSGNSSVLTALNTLNGDSAGVGSATGFFEPLAAGSQINIVGGVSKLTFQGTPGWQNQFVNIGGAGLTGLSQFYDAYIAANSVAPSGDINHFIMSPKLLAAYRNELFAQERFIDSTKLDGGRMALAFNGAIAEQDPEMGFACSVAGNVDGYMLNYDGIKLIFHSDADFAVSPFEYVSGTTARAAQLYVKCQLVADFLGGQAMLINL